MKDEIETVYVQYEGLIVKLATGNQNLFVDVLGKEDAIQEAGLAFVIAYRQYEQYGEAVLGNQQALPGFFRSVILNHLKNAIKRELAYQNRHPEYLDEASYDVIPDLDLDAELQVLEKEELAQEEKRLRVVRLLLSHPQLLVDRAGLTVNQSYVIWRTYINQFTERRIAKTMKVTKTVVHNIISAGLKKLQRFIIHNT